MYDLLIIGGGINGLGIAADASARGLSALLAERDDFGAATTAASSRLIHGGLRYLQYGELGLVREALRERGLLARQRPHLVRPISLLLPVRRGDATETPGGPPIPAWKIAAGLALYAFLARDPLFPAPRRLSVAEIAGREPGLSRDGLTTGFLYPDAQIEFPERLCIDLLRETLAAGGEALNHTSVVALRPVAGGFAARLRDSLSGAEREVAARLVLNAAGPWVDAVNRLLPSSLPRLLGGTRGIHLLLPARAEGPRGPLYTSARKDGRPIFLLPWDGRLLVGTTEVPVADSPQPWRPEPWEIDYLLTETNAAFPGCRYDDSDVLAVTSGVRPLPASRRAAAAVTRRHFLVDHAIHGVPGLASLVGGKLTTYRSFAEAAVDWALRRLGRRPVPCPTRAIPGDAPEPEALEREAAAALARWLPESAARAAAGRLARLYGPRWREVTRRIDARPELAAPIFPPSEQPAGSVTGAPVLLAELLHAAETERARTIEDAARRLMLFPAAPERAAALRAAAGAFGLGLR